MDVATVRRLYEAGLPLLFLAVALRSSAVRGVPITLRELGFGFALSQAVELLAVHAGRYRYPDWLVYFPPSPRWVPLGVGLGWAALMPVVMRLSEQIAGERAPRWRLAALDGLLGVGLDLVVDPVVSGEPLRMWLWRDAGMADYRWWLLDVPVFNFVGWFLLVGACGWQLRAIEANAGRRLWLALGFLVTDLAVAAVVMRLPW